MWNPNAGPNPYPPQAVCPGGSNPACPPPINPAFPPGPCPPGIPQGTQHSLRVGHLTLYHNQAVQGTGPQAPTLPVPTPAPGMCPVNPLAPGMVGPGIVVDKKTHKKMKKEHKKKHKQHKHGKHSSSSSSSSSSSDSD